MNRRAVLTGTLAFACVLAVMPSCTVEECDVGITHCRTVCTWWCDIFGCYPTCFDDCWVDCVVAPRARPATPLCMRCDSDDDCSRGALCIRPGGDPAAPAFCGLVCNDTTASTDCPPAFRCSAVGSSRQCLPISGACR